MEFSRQEYQSGLPFPSPGDLPNPGIETGSPVSVELQVNSLPAEPSGKPRINCILLEIKNMNLMTKGLPRWFRVKNLPTNTGDAGDAGLIPVSGR